MAKVSFKAPRRPVVILLALAGTVVAVSFATQGLHFDWDDALVVLAIVAILVLVAKRKIRGVNAEPKEEKPVDYSVVAVVFVGGIGFLFTIHYWGVERALLIFGAAVLVWVSAGIVRFVRWRKANKTK